MDTVVALLVLLGALVLVFGVRGRGIWQAATTPDGKALNLNPLTGIDLRPNINVEIPNPFTPKLPTPPILIAPDEACGVPGSPPCP